jgi:hypothetical protein
MSYRTSQENLRLIDKPRKKPNASFQAKYDSGVCSVCFLAVTKGQTVRFNRDGELIHTNHKIKPQIYTICDRCYMAKPCICEDDS